MLPVFLARAKQGHRVAALERRPKLDPHLDYVMDAFWSLVADRGGDGSGPILFRAIDAYARRMGIGDGDSREFQDFETLIRAMDAVWLKDARRRREQAERDARNRAKVWGR